MIPKARNANTTILASIGAETFVQNYVCQEKLNGAFVLWNGKELLTKSGNAVYIPLIQEFMIPGFAFVAELFFGYGQKERAMAATFAQNKKPQVSAYLSEAAAQTAVDLLWKHCRVVAFDVPILDKNWPYERRYNLLCRMVAAWTTRRDRQLQTTQGKKSAPHFPLQVIRSYAIKFLGPMFEEVIVGTTDKRQYPPFGIPKNGQEDTTYWTHDAWSGESAFVNTSMSCGEGLMLYDIKQLWMTRRLSSDRGTTAILKYKPIILTVGVVVREPEHTHHRMLSSDSETDKRTPGYQVKVRWFDPVRGSIVVLTPYIPPTGNPASIVQRFRVGPSMAYTYTQNMPSCACRQYFFSFTPTE